VHPPIAATIASGKLGKAITQVEKTMMRDEAGLILLRPISAAAWIKKKRL
jgi:hypothetical protein